MCRGAHAQRDSRRAKRSPAARAGLDDAIVTSPRPPKVPKSEDDRWKWVESADGQRAHAALAGVLILGALPWAQQFSTTSIFYFASLAVCTIYIGAHKSLSGGPRQQLSMKEVRSRWPRRIHALQPSVRTFSGMGCTRMCNMAFDIVWPPSPMPAYTPAAHNLERCCRHCELAIAAQTRIDLTQRPGAAGPACARRGLFLPLRSVPRPQVLSRSFLPDLHRRVLSPPGLLLHLQRRLLPAAGAHPQIMSL